MKQTAIIFVVLMTLSVSASAQWRKIADFKGPDNGTPYTDEIVTSVYFLDLPGPPRVGFVGTESELWKTLDGGKNWTSVWDSGASYSNYYITSICFKDSLIGWFSIIGSSDACYRTVDGGKKWVELTVPSWNSVGAVAVCYSQNTTRLFLSMDDDSGMRVSSDLGDTWQVAGKISGGISFSSDSNGIAAAYPPDGDTDHNHALLNTSDGGMSWNLVETPAFCRQPLAILGSPICFVATWGDPIIYRSDDYGQTWRQIYDFGTHIDSNSNVIGPEGTGIIGGDLSRLYIQTLDSGMYVSTDQGLSWQKDGGPSFNYFGCRFYCAKGVTIAGMTLNNGFYAGGGLWEEDWPQSGVKEQGYSSNASLQVYPNPAIDMVECSWPGGAKEITLMDILGNTVRSYHIVQSSTSLRIPTEGLAAGTYYVRVTFANGSVETRPLAVE